MLDLTIFELTFSVRVRLQLRNDMSNFQESLRNHFSEMEEDYIRVKAELHQLRFDHKDLVGRSSQELERVRCPHPFLLAIWWQ